MRESEHFNLFLAEGSDIVNPLVQDVPNYETIDVQMFKNQNAGVQNATELKSGTVHAITRNVPDAQFITFTATSNYTAGETFTVDGVQVSALTVGGETLPTGAYVINSQVLCVLKGTLLTVYGVGSREADNALALNGHPDTYFGTKEEVDNAMETANAAKTIADALNALKPKLLWTNANPSVAFSAQNIVIPNLSEYDFIEVYANYNTNIPNGNSCYSKSLKGKGGNLDIVLPSNNAPYGTSSVHRSYSVSGNNIAFTDCTYGYTGHYEVRNTANIPFQIYGGKY